MTKPPKWIQLDNANLVDEDGNVTARRTLLEFDGNAITESAGQIHIKVKPGQDFSRPPPRADAGFLKFTSLTSYQDFASLADSPPAAWSFGRTADAAQKILASQQYSPTAAYGVQRLAPGNARGFYTRNFNFHQALNLDPAHGGTWAGSENELAVYLSGTETYPEEWFVHEDGTSTWQGRIQNRLIANKPRYLMKFDNEDFFEEVIAPWIDELYQDWIDLGFDGAPGIFVDLCPGSRGLWRNAAGDLVPTLQFDHFQTEAEYQAAWATTFRRIRARFPNLQIMVNWGVDPTEDISDAVLEVIDGVFFETKDTFTPPVQRRSLAVSFRAGQLGKTVAFCGQYAHDTVPPTVDDFGRDYFCAFLLTMGPGHLWGGQWVKPSTAYSGAVADVEPFTRWIGPPQGPMHEIMPGLWHRRFANLDVFLNTTEFSPYTVRLQGNVDDDDAGVTSVDLSPGEGAYFFRQSPRAIGYANSGYDFQLPKDRAGDRLRVPHRVILDALLGSAAIGASSSGGNLLNDTTLADVGSSITISDPGVTHLGVTMLQGVINSSGSQFTYDIDLTGEDGKYLHVFFYAQKISGDVDALMLLLSGVGSAIMLTPLKYGDPELHHGVVQVPVGAGASALTFQTRPDASGLGTIRWGGVKLLLSDTPDTDDVWAEYVGADAGVPLSRGAGVGISQTAWLRKISGYTRADGGAPTIELLGGTDIDGLPVKKIYEEHTTTDLSNKGNGAYETLVTVSIADWGKARQLVAQFCASWTMDTALGTNAVNWRMLLDGTQIGPVFSFAAPSTGVNYSGFGHAVAALPAGAHTLVLQALCNSAGLSMDKDDPLYEAASLLATIAEVV